jgi:hypothetical protein
VQRIWDQHNLKPWRVETFKLSNDKRFVEKLTDVVGLYLNPPEKAIVLCVDEKSQIQAQRTHQQAHPPRRVSLRARPDRSDQGVTGGLQPGRRAVRVDRRARQDHREDRSRPHRARSSPMNGQLISETLH